MPKELKVISDFYDFMLYLTQRIEKFPRHHRHSIGISIENRLQTILTALLKAKFNSRDSDSLDEANIELEILRFQIRLAKDLRALPIKSQGHANRLILFGFSVRSVSLHFRPTDCPLQSARNRRFFVFAG